FFHWLVIPDGVCPAVESAKCRMSMPEQSGDSFDFCVLFRVYFTGKGAIILIIVINDLFRQNNTKVICIRNIPNIITNNNRIIHSYTSKSK
ncbi:MAG: hypothetical protein UFB05_05695, partial [[Eubacterium] siraeum]|nr:hypothetical protein [[Eubacterium] siraeum]